MAEERVESQGFFEMLWDCDHCETKGLLGKSQRHCPECGAKQNPDKRYFPKEGDTAQRVDGHKYEGSDRQCPHCGAPQSAKANNCTHCGAPQDGASEVRGVLGAPKPPPAKRKWWPPVAIIAVVIALIFGIWYACVRTTSAQVTVTGHSWACTVAVEEYGDISGEAWRESVPHDARVLGCRSKQKSSRQVPDGETCTDERVDRKDGTFEVVRKCRPRYRSEPVEGEWCSFTRRGWKQVDQLRSAGTGLAIACPTDDFQPARQDRTVGEKRRGATKETRTLQLGKHSCEVSDAKWRSLADGAAVKVEVRARSGEIVCSSL